MGLFKILFGGGKYNKPNRGSYVDEEHLGEVLDRHTHPITGEVKGIVTIEEVHNPNNRVDIREVKVDDRGRPDLD